MKGRKPAALFLAGALVLLSFPGCQLLALPFQIVNTGLQGAKWFFQNAGGLIPLAGYLVMEDRAPALPAGTETSPAELLRSPPQGALALVLVPPADLGDPGLEKALKKGFSGPVRVVPLRFPPGAAPLPSPPEGALPLLAAAK